MNRRQALAVVGVTGFGALRPAIALSPTEAYELTVVFDGERPEARALVVLNGRAFRTLSSQALRNYLTRLRPEVIRYDRGCLRGGELNNILPTDAEIMAFADFCATKKITLVLPPAG